MILLNELQIWSALPEENYRTLLILLAPFAPHLAEYLWEMYGGQGSVHQAPWPDFNQFQSTENADVVVVQVNGKRRGEISLWKGASQNDALSRALDLPNVEVALGEKPPARVVYVPGRILNLVTV